MGWQEQDGYAFACVTCVEEKRRQDEAGIIESLRRHSGLTPGQWDIGIQPYSDRHPVHRKVLASANLFGSTVNMAGTLLCLTGPTGTGKTRLALKMCVDYIRMRTPVLYVPAGMLTYRLAREAMSDEQHKGAFEQAVEVAVLVIDDLSAEEFRTDFRQGIIYTLINSRLQTGKPTIITTNLSFEDITRLEPRLGSRLKGMQAMLLSTAGVPDMRTPGEDAKWLV